MPPSLVLKIDGMEQGLKNLRSTLVEVCLLLDTVNAVV